MAYRTVVLACSPYSAAPVIIRATMIQYMPVHLLKRRQVGEITTLSRASIYDMIKRGVFPKPIKIGERAVAWREADIIAWLDACMAAAADEEVAP